MCNFVALIFANHNKDYSVVKTSKAGQLAFFVSPIDVRIVIRLLSACLPKVRYNDKMVTN